MRSPVDVGTLPAGSRAPGSQTAWRAGPRRAPSHCDSPESSVKEAILGRKHTPDGSGFH